MVTLSSVPLKNTLKSTLNLPAAQYIPEEATVVKVDPDDPSTWTMEINKYSDYKTNNITVFDFSSDEPKVSANYENYTAFPAGTFFTYNFE